jgi:hypothetical protein
VVMMSGKFFLCTSGVYVSPVASCHSRTELRSYRSFQNSNTICCEMCIIQGIIEIRWEECNIQIGYYNIDIVHGQLSIITNQYSLIIIFNQHSFVIF